MYPSKVPEEAECDGLILLALTSRSQPQKGTNGKSTGLPASVLYREGILVPGREPWTVLRASRPSKRVYMGTWGSYDGVKSKECWRYHLSLTDDYSRLSFLYLKKDREAATVQGIWRDS
jgi:hypothetical protein